MANRFYPFTGGQAGDDGWEGGNPNPDECAHCKGGVDMTDVEGHYSGICQRCRQQHPKEYEEALQKEMGN